MSNYRCAEVRIVRVLPPEEDLIITGATNRLDYLAFGMNREYVSRSNDYKRLILCSFAFRYK